MLGPRRAARQGLMWGPPRSGATRSLPEGLADELPRFEPPDSSRAGPPGDRQCGGQEQELAGRVTTQPGGDLDQVTALLLPVFRRDAAGLSAADQGDQV